MKREFTSFLRFSLLAISTSICLSSASQDDQSITRNYYRLNLKRIIDHIVPNRNEMRAKLFMDMDTLPLLIHGQVKGELVRSEEIYFDSVKYKLDLYDMDRDGRADAFHIPTEEGEATNDYGYIYDLNKDSMVDYIVFNGGMEFSHDQQYYRCFYHWVDLDYDGKIDAQTISIVIQPGDSMADPHYVLWVIDNNQDGKPEAMEFMHLPDGAVRPLEKEANKWSFKTNLGKRVIDSDELYFKPFNAIFEKVKHF